MRGKQIQTTLTLAACVLLLAAAAGALEIRTYTADEIGFMASSHILLGEEEAILVDAQFTRPDTWGVVDLIEESGRRLTTVFVTSPRPERYMGLAFLRNHYPDVRFLAHPSTVEAIAAVAADDVERWRPIYLSDIPPEPVVPSPLGEDEVLRLDGQVLEVHQLATAAPGTAVLYVRDEHTLFASDLAFNAVHPLLDNDPAALAEELGQLLETLGQVDWVYPGWGSGGGQRLLDDSLAYLAALGDTLAQDDAAAAMRSKYPDYEMAIFLERTVHSARTRPPAETPPPAQTPPAQSEP